MNDKSYIDAFGPSDLTLGDKNWLKTVFPPLEESAIRSGQRDFKMILSEEAAQREAHQQFLHSPYISTTDNDLIRDCMSKNMINQFTVTGIELTDSWCVGPMGDPTAFRTNFCVYINGTKINLSTIWSECPVCPFMERGKRYVWPLRCCP